MRAAVRLALLFAALGACEPSDRAVDPVWGRQPCAYCGMVVGDPRTAAELVRADGTRLFFDDVGCMIVYARDLPAAPLHAWVHAAEGPSWLDAERARYVGGAHTPMDFGYVAVDRGAGLTFEEARSAVLARRGSEARHDP